jgi:uncharacterized RDD family membrane protein YckC
VPFSPSTNQKLDTLQTIQVADGVEIQLSPVGPVPRALAYALDALIILASLMLIGIGLTLAGAVAGFDTAAFSGGIFLLIFFVAEWGYHALFESCGWGASPGKRSLGLRVVRSSGVALTLREALVRNIIRSADSAPSFFGIVGLFTMLFTRRFQRLGDLAADALVVYDMSSAKHQRFQQPDFTPLRASDNPAMAPPVALKRDEQRAITSFANRLLSWSPPRQQEIAGHLHALTERHGPEAVTRLQSMAKWLRES